MTTRRRPADKNRSSSSTIAQRCVAYPRHAPYRLVAEVEAARLEAIFDLTNHGVHQQDWRTNPGIQVCATARVRSTSGGDVVVVPNGTPWICAPVGWCRIALDGSICACWRATPGSCTGQGAYRKETPLQAYISTHVRLAMSPSGTRLSFRAANGEELATTLALGRPVSLCTLTDQAVVAAVQQQCGVRVPLVASPALITLWPGDVLFLLQVDFQGRVEISQVVAQATTEPQPQRVIAIADELPAVWVGECSTPC